MIKSRILNSGLAAVGLLISSAAHAESAHLILDYMGICENGVLAKVALNPKQPLTIVPYGVSGDSYDQAQRDGNLITIDSENIEVDAKTLQVKLGDVVIGRLKEDSSSLKCSPGQNGEADMYGPTIFALDAAPSLTVRGEFKKVACVPFWGFLQAAKANTYVLTFSNGGEVKKVNGLQRPGMGQSLGSLFTCKGGSEPKGQVLYPASRK